MIACIVCFVLGANFGFIVAGLLHAGRQGKLPPEDEKETR